MSDQLIPWAVNDFYQDGWDFADAVNEVRMETKQSATKTAGLFLREFGELPDGYTMDNFNRIDGNR